MSSFKEIACRAVSQNTDPWVSMLAEKLPMERAIAHRYNSNGDWDQVPALVKLEASPFASGSMRHCYRLKKILQAPHAKMTAPDWSRASNYVAKQFKAVDETIDGRARYFRDVAMQAEAKRFAEEFNRTCRPPKQIDMINTFIIELVDRDESPLFAVERFISGVYLKHNSNCGFVDDIDHRMTPQTFSHWTYLQSNGTRMVVDIQGVNDLFTDPQIHSIDGRWEDGDLRVRGMALFFCSHVCNSLCSLLAVDPIAAPHHDIIPVITPPTPSQSISPRAGLHREMAIIHQEGRFRSADGIIHGDPDPAGAYFHLITSVKMGDPVAVLALVRFCSGEIDANSSELLPDDLETRLPRACFEDEFRSLLWDYLVGCDLLSGLVHVARQAITGFEWARGAALLRRALSLPPDAQVARYELLFLLGDLLRQGGHGVDRDSHTARELLMEAAELASAKADLFIAKQCFDRVELITE